MNRNQQHIDVKLIEAYKSGDEKQLALLVERWHLKFCKKAYWIVKDADLSKDIAQESWNIIIDKLHTLHNPSSFKSWAMRIVYSKSMDVLRAQNRRRLNTNALKKESEDAVPVEDDQYLEQLKIALLKAIHMLPQQQQIVIRLFYTQDYSLKEISDMLNISVGTTKSRLFHAREKLKSILKTRKI
ncbi:RNA polymerase sigma factor [uncultured Psychroserpens sp.]|uniref:RNA polymerase sigma factor n=1 Tax=uncultured Psychroserpens sp. TaxID=255436 RepID=UPI0026379307|nr:RNA polymerase sigma factor [uncultured Psychroserpens sp.]